MTKHTSRDEVWNLALRYAFLEESFKISRVEDEMAETVSRRTVRDTLNTMVDYGWLIKNSPQAHEWHPGPMALDVDKLEESFSTSPSSSDEVDVYPGVDEVKERYSDRVSNSANLVIEEVSGSHALGSHGPLEEYVKIPYVDGEPLAVMLPRTRQTSRVLVCREQSVVRGDGGVQLVQQPELRIDDVVPVQVPPLIQADETQEEVQHENLDGVPLPLFRNADTLQISNSVNLKPGWQYAVKIDTITDRTASGSIYDRAKWQSSSSGGSSPSKSLNDIAESVGSVTESANTTAIGHIASDWDDRRKRLLTDIGHTYD